MTTENCRDGVTVGWKLIRAIRFADDQAILTDDTRTMDRLTATADGLRIKINTKKTKCMTISKGEATNPIMKANGFCWIKRMSLVISAVTEDDRCHDEIR